MATALIAAVDSSAGTDSTLCDGAVRRAFYIVQGQQLPETVITGYQAAQLVIVGQQGPTVAIAGHKN